MTRSNASSGRSRFGFGAFAVRWVAALILVLASYNPSGTSFFHWVTGAVGDGELGALHLFIGAVLLAGWSVFIIATNRSLGSFGVFIGGLLIGAGIWLLVEIGLIRADSARAATWLALVALATLLAIGLSWSHIWRRLSGQLEVDDD
ncbi:DUF6524 family protein [Elongatibacter sediminis]|uniref:DUF6524 family protein n=1 Tax=Elongatibacter sediminis TaxID=3119006 RepID=A0AAW9RB30_9GAMM